MLMRSVTGLFAIIAILMGLWTGPFFHIHEVYDFHTHGQLAKLHSHFSEVLPDSDFSGTRIEDEHHPHRGISVSVIAGSGRKAQVMVVELQSSCVNASPFLLTGFGVDTPVRVHDPPSRRNSRPRSPPA